MDVAALYSHFKKEGSLELLVIELKVTPISRLLYTRYTQFKFMYIEQGLIYLLNI